MTTGAAETAGTYEDLGQTTSSQWERAWGTLLESLKPGSQLLFNTIRQAVEHYADAAIFVVEGEEFSLATQKSGVTSPISHELVCASEKRCARHEILETIRQLGEGVVSEHKSSGIVAKIAHEREPRKESYLIYFIYTNYCDQTQLDRLLQLGTLL